MDFGSREPCDRRLVNLCEQRRRVFSVPLAVPSRKRGDLEELHERSRQCQRWEEERVFISYCT